MLLLGSAVNDKKAEETAYLNEFYCTAARSGIFTMGAVLSLATVILGILAYASEESSKNRGDPWSPSVAPEQLGIAMEEARRASGRLGCVRVLSDPDRRSILDPRYLDGEDVVTCPSLLKVKAECVRVLSDPDRRNVLDPGYLDGGDVATCPGLPNTTRKMPSDNTHQTTLDQKSVAQKFYTTVF
ncbi:hypothetical protein AgCh_023150 [Apium graveolens]